MTGNRVEQLESRVRELEATVGGLTDELMDAKERVQALENAVDFDDATATHDRRNDIVEGDLAQGEDTTTATTGTETESDAGAGAEGDTVEAGDDGEERDAPEHAGDIIVA